MEKKISVTTEERKALCEFFACKQEDLSYAFHFRRKGQKSISIRYTAVKSFGGECNWAFKDFEVETVYNDNQKIMKQYWGSRLALHLYMEKGLVLLYVDGSFFNQIYLEKIEELERLQADLKILCNIL